MSVIHQIYASLDPNLVNAALVSLVTSITTVGMHLVSEHNGKVIPSMLWWLKWALVPLDRLRVAFASSTDPSAEKDLDRIAALEALAVKLQGQLEAMQAAQVKP